MSPATLLGRIGTDGTEFVIGAKFKAPAKGDDTVYLRIMPGPGNTDSGAITR